MARVILKNVTKKFKDVIAVDKASIDIQDKEFGVLVGPSGYGKGTTLHAVAGLEGVPLERSISGIGYSMTSPQRPGYSHGLPKPCPITPYGCPLA